MPISRKCVFTTNTIGGIIIIDKNGDALVLDLIYYRNEVVNYLLTVFEYLPISIYKR